MSLEDVTQQQARKAVHFAAAGGITNTDLAAVNAAAAAAQSTANAIKAGAATDADTLVEVAGKITSAVATLKGSADVSGDTLGELEALAAAATAEADAIKAGTSSSNDTLIEVFNAIASQITTATTTLKGSATAAGDTLGELEARIHTLETQPAGGNGFNKFSPDAPYLVPSAYDDEFDAGSLDSKWSTLNSPAVGFSIPNMVEIDATGTGAYNGIAQNIATGDLDTDIIFAAKFILPRVYQTDQFEMGLWYHAYATFPSDIRQVTLGWDPINHRFLSTYLDNFSVLQVGNVAGSGTSTAESGLFQKDVIYMRMRYDSTNHLMYWSFSFDGILWLKWNLSGFAAGVNDGNFGGDKLRRVGIFIRGTAGYAGYCDWFRKQQGTYFGRNLVA